MTSAFCEPWPAERWELLPVSLIAPELLVMPVHDLDLRVVERLILDDLEPQPIHVDARSGEFRVADGRHRALAALAARRRVPARVLTLAHQP